MAEESSDPPADAEPTSASPSVANGPRRRTRSRKSMFFRGMVTLLPAVLTIFVFVTVLQFVDRYLASPINGAISSFLEGNALGWEVLRVMDVDPHDVEFVSENKLPLDLRDAARRDGLDSASFQAKLSNWREGRSRFFRNYD
jgi:hypothetical protein